MLYRSIKICNEEIQSRLNKWNDYSEKDNGKLYDQILGLQIQKMRIDKGLGLQDLGDSLNVSFQQIQKYIKGINEISHKKLKLLAEKTDTDLTYFEEPVNTHKKTITIKRGK